jgi:myo-inositol 2-dehydrogenase/D-chiro-inositol 1-dehydrogenase
LTFRICLVGCGRHAAAQHGPSYRRYGQARPGVSLAACCSRSSARAQAFAERFGFDRSYSDVALMLREVQPHAVGVVVPVEAAAEVAAAVLEAGCPLIVEKPPARSARQTAALAASAARRKIPTRVAFNRRYHPLIREVKRRLAAPVDRLRYDMIRRCRTERDFSTTAIHVIDAARHLAGADYQLLRFSYQELPELGPGVANFFLDGTMVSGARVHLAICPVGGRNLEEATLEAGGSAYLVTTPADSACPGILRLAQRDGTMTTVVGHRAAHLAWDHDPHGFHYQNATFFDAVQAGTPVEGGLESAVQSVAVAECLRARAPLYEVGAP